MLIFLKVTLHVQPNSKTSLSGISIDDILSRGSWSNESTWKKIYHKQVLSKEQLFQEGVLK